MSKERIISVRLTPETESKLNCLIKEANTGEITSEQTLSDIVERCIHNEWCSINYSNLSIIEDVIVDENYVTMIKDRSEKILVQ